ncbi:hypothetical protein EDD86DRAFT_125074 [Gorgonomyces haynaldii]|nr:hypothetical protein EDD86DRAFT_125074 [Gorgonomyces haynaldii]
MIGGLSVLMTSSPVPSNPSTEFLEICMDSFNNVPGLKDCPLVFCLDGFTDTENKYETKFKSCRISPEEAVRYQQYKHNVKHLLTSRIGLKIEDLKPIEPKFHGWCDPNAQVLKAVNGHLQVTVIEFNLRCGFALAVKQGLDYIETEFVLVQQHDWQIKEHCDFEPLLNVMRRHPVSYIGFISKTSKDYCWRLTTSRGVIESVPKEFDGITLAPLFFWYDKTHLASVKHYKEFVFGRPRFKRGDFIEDTMGILMLEEIKVGGMTAHEPYQSYLYYPEQGQQVMLRHINGRRFGNKVKYLDQIENRTAREKTHFDWEQEGLNLLD